MTRRRLAWILGLLAGGTALLALAGILVLQSGWFYNHVRERIVAEVERATGGRVELRAFRFDWTHLRAEAGGLVVHGTEPADRPPLLRASSVAVVLKLVSLWKRDVDVRYLEVNSPHVYLMVNPDGSTNLPSPKTPPNPASRTLDPLFQLAAGRFAVLNGLFEMESRGKLPFQARGQNLGIALFLDAANSRYRGTVSMKPLEVQAPGVAATPLDVAMSVALSRDRIAIESANIASGGSTLQLAGAIEELKSPHGSFQYTANAAVDDVARTFGIELLEHGAVQSRGSVDWPGGSQYSVAGDLHAAGVDYLGAYVQLRSSRAEGTLSVNPQRVELSSLRFSTSVRGPGRCTGNRWPCPTALGGNVATAEVRGKDLELRGLAVALLGGSFRGQARLENLRRFTVDGEISGVEARRAVALYSAAPLPWNGLVSGKTHAEGLLQRQNELRASVDLTLAPAPQGPSVHGQVAAA